MIGSVSQIVKKWSVTNINKMDEDKVLRVTTATSPDGKRLLGQQRKRCGDNLIIVRERI